MLSRKVNRSMSRWLPQLARSTSPGLGVVHTSYIRARAACPASISRSVRAKKSRRMAPVLCRSSSTVWSRREAQPFPTLPQTRQRRGDRPRSSRLHPPRSGSSTSRSNSRPRGSRSSMEAHNSLICRPEPRTAHRASQPVGRSISSRERVLRPAVSRAASRRSSPSRKARRIVGPFFTGPGMFMVKETTGQPRLSRISRWRLALASLASSISSNVTSCSMA